MDPIALSFAFATLVGLLCNYKQEKQDQQKLSSRDFLDWLQHHGHEELREMIRNAQELDFHIDTFLQKSHEAINAELSKIDDILASISSHVEGLSGIVQALKPDYGLSDQAMTILRQLVQSKAEEFGKIVSMGGISLLLVPGGKIEIKEPRFIEDDLSRLVQLALLRLRIGSKGSEFYGITRNAVKLIEAVHWHPQ